VTLRRLNISKYNKDSEGSVMDVTHGEMVDAKLNRLIEKRSSRETDPDERDELWKASVAAYNARRREEHRRQWCDYFRRIATSLRSRAEEYDHRAQALLEDRGEGVC
jgi:hypothetical protein